MRMDFTVETRLAFSADWYLLGDFLAGSTLIWKLLSVF